MAAKNLSWIQDGVMVGIFDLDGNHRINIEFKEFWFERLPDKDTWRFRGVFMHDLCHPVTKKVLCAKNEEVELRRPLESDDEDEEW